MQNSQRERAVELVLTGDDDTVEQASLGGAVNGIGQRNGRTEGSDLHTDTDALHTPLDNLSILPAMRGIIL